MHWSRSYNQNEFGTADNPSPISISVPTLNQAKISEYLDDAEVTIRSALKNILSNSDLAPAIGLEKVDYERIYKLCEALCLNQKSLGLYQLISAELHRFISHQLKKILKQKLELGLDFLLKIQAFWQNLADKLALLSTLFVYLDRTFVLQSSDLLSIWDLGVEKLQTELKCNRILQTHLTEQLLDGITKERDGDKNILPVIKSLVGMYLSLGIYTTEFEPQLLAMSQKYYCNEASYALKIIKKVHTPADSSSELRSFSSEIISHITGVSSYFDYAEARLYQENMRVDIYLSPETRHELLKIVQTELLAKQMSSLLRLGFSEIMESYNLPALKKIYMLAQLVNQRNSVRSHFLLYCKTAGTKLTQQLTQNPAQGKSFVPMLITMKNKMNIVLSECFNDNEQFNHALTEAFEYIINKQQSKSAKLISKYLDEKLRLKSVNESELEKNFDQVLKLFRFLDSKLSFETFYKRDMAKRLILNKSSSKDAERLLLLKLKLECGSGFTNKLEGMLRDMTQSNELVEQFKQTDDGKSISDFDFNVNVLTLSFWPNFPNSKLVFPKSVQDSQEKFTNFYKKLYNGRKLIWDIRGDDSGAGNAAASSSAVSGYAILSTDFGASKGGVKEFVVSHSQAAVLMLFVKPPTAGGAGNLKNQSQSQIEPSSRPTYEHIQQQLCLEDDELQVLLQSLCFGKIRPLTRHPESSNLRILSTDSFTFNESCINELQSDTLKGLFRYKINMLPPTASYLQQQNKRMSMSEKSKLKAASGNFDTRKNATSNEPSKMRVDSLQESNKDRHDQPSKSRSSGERQHDQQDSDDDDNDNESYISGQDQGLGQGRSQGQEPMEQTNNAIQLDQMYQLDAAIVRLLKYHRTLKHNQLIVELNRTMKFPIQTSVVKKRIESLIDRDYMERNSEDIETYNYVA